MRHSKPWAQVVLVVLALFAATTGCRSLSTATPDEVDPAAIEASIRSQILTQYPGETFDIGVSVSDAGVVTLTGTVDSAEKRTRIGQLASSVDGVDRVVNELTVG
jgi:osmotically-inducible protein OsmY